MESIINLRVVNKLVIPQDTNIKTINGISMVATPYNTNINVGNGTLSNVLIDGGSFVAPTNSVLIDAGSF